LQRQIKAGGFFERCLFTFSDGEEAQLEGTCGFLRENVIDPRFLDLKINDFRLWLAHLWAKGVTTFVLDQPGKIIFDAFCENQFKITKQKYITEYAAGAHGKRVQILTRFLALCQFLSDPTTITNTVGKKGAKCAIALEEVYFNVQLNEIFPWTWTWDPSCLEYLAILDMQPDNIPPNVRKQAPHHVDFILKNQICSSTVCAAKGKNWTTDKVLRLFSEMSEIGYGTFEKASVGKSQQQVYLFKKKDPKTIDLQVTSPQSLGLATGFL